MESVVIPLDILVTCTSNLVSFLPFRKVLGKHRDVFTMVNAMQWVVRTVVQRANAITLVIDKDNKGIANSTLKLSIVTCKLSTVMGILYRDMP